MKEHIAIKIAVFLFTIAVGGLTLYLKNLDDRNWARFTERVKVRSRREQ